MKWSFIEFLQRVTGSSVCNEIEVIQSLWSGYGKISRYRLSGGPYSTVVVKNISLGAVGNHPRGWDTNASHTRKVESYKVETTWYEQWSPLCTSACRIPRFIGSYSEGSEQWIVLEDLDVDFPFRKNSLGFSEVKVVLTWLANFHARFLHQEPKGLWEIGTYWHLATRQDEFNKIENQELKGKAHLLDAMLNDCRFKTIVHGDAKVANFCFSEDGMNVAAVDFQYVGGGCGMKDVAYFLGSCLASEECSLYEEELLNFYFSELQNALLDALDFNELEAEWRAMYPIACADFTRFLLGWMPTHQKVNAYNTGILERVLGGV